ncbi:MAG: RNA 2',3'-cyclic phosphodiesterase, partial [Candidatus Zixiibacteriota bacterium]
WVGVEKNDALVHLRNKIESRLVRAGLTPESRKFVPHVVIARLKETKLNKLADFLARNSLLHLQPFTISGFNLYSSHLGSRGASYEIEQEYQLTARRDTPV